MEKKLIEDELRELRARLAPGALDHLDIILRSAERRAVRDRIEELEEDLEALGHEAGYGVLVP